MSSKETIFEALKANSPAPVERGPLGFTPMTFSDPLAEFRERAVKAAAARCILIEEGDDKASADTELSGNRATSSGDRTPEEEKPGSIRERIASIVRRTYPEARRIASNLPEAASCATFNPDELEDPRDLAGTDVAIVRGAFGVVENGAVWIPRAFRHKAMLFIPEALVILLDRKQIVCNMHEAYAREDFDTYDFSSKPLSSAPTEPGTSRSSCCRPSGLHSSCPLSTTAGNHGKCCRCGRRTEEECPVSESRQMSRSSSTGQWSEPKTSLWIAAPSSLG